MVPEGRRPACFPISPCCSTPDSNGRVIDIRLLQRLLMRRSFESGVLQQAEMGIKNMQSPNGPRPVVGGGGGTPAGENHDITSHLHSRQFVKNKYIDLIKRAAGAERKVLCELLLTFKNARQDSLPYPARVASGLTCATTTAAVLTSSESFSHESDSFP